MKQILRRLRGAVNNMNKPSLKEPAPELAADDLQKLGLTRSDWLTHVRERFAQEQSWFWTRFAAFSALHGALFVVVATDAGLQWLAVPGAILGFIWLVVQTSSYGYVEQVKKPYYAEEERIKKMLPSTEEAKSGSWIPPSTGVAMFAAGLVFAGWLALAVLLLSP